MRGILITVRHALVSPRPIGVRRPVRLVPRLPRHQMKTGEG